MRHHADSSHTPRTHHFRALAYALVASLLLVAVPAASSSAFPSSLELPFTEGEAWYVCQGYNGQITHHGKPHFDLTTTSQRGTDGCWGGENAASGKPIYAPAAGSLLDWGDSYGAICLNFESGGGSMMFAHLKNQKKTGTVKKGDKLGDVAPAGEKLNGGYAHLHLEAFSAKNCAPSSVVPFAKSVGAQFRCAPDLPFDPSKRNQWAGTKLMRCAEEKALTATPTPTISGTSRMDSTLTAKPGTWSPAPVTLKYQWKRGGANISGATASTYKLTAADVGATITVSVTGSKSGYKTVTKTSKATAKVAPGEFSSAPAPTIAGAAKVDSKLAATTGEWSPTPATLAIQWQRDGVNIPGATASTYTLTPGDAGAAITVSVTASRNGYTTTTRTSAPTAKVVMGEFTSAPTPTVTGTARAGAKLTASPGSWQPAPGALTYQWFRDGSAISGATVSTYEVRQQDAGRSIRVEVTATRKGYTKRMVKSSSVKIAALKEWKTTPRPKIKGKAKVDSKLRATPGSWSPSGAKLSYQWRRNGKAISGATKSTYRLAQADIGKRLTVAVTAKRIGFRTVTRISKATTKVTAMPLKKTYTPKITGIARIDSTLKATVKAWTPKKVTLKYQWKRDGKVIPRATSTTYRVTTADLGKRITVSVTGSRKGYKSKVRTSKATAEVTSLTWKASPAPVITGEVKVDSTIQASVGEWSPTPQFTFQWSRDGAAIPGATSTAYALTPADAGTEITVTVKAAKTGYLTASRTSAKTTPVALGDFAETPAPTISGSTWVGSTLSANAGAWSPKANISYQWLRDGTAIKGATAQKYKLVHADLAAKITVQAKGSAQGYTPITRTSKATAAVMADSLVADSRLYKDQSLHSRNGNYRLTLQADGNLVLRNVPAKKVIWANATDGKGATSLRMQTDGNLVQYNASGKAVWATATDGKKGTYVRVQDDGNVVIYTAEKKAVWATNTWGK